MRKIREILRLRAEGFTDEQVAASVGCARSTVQECLRRARAAGVGWPPPVELDEASLNARLYPRRDFCVAVASTYRRCLSGCMPLTEQGSLWN